MSIETDIREIFRGKHYGLEIGVDANGHASYVAFPDGAYVDE